MNYLFTDDTTYGYPYFEKRDGRVYFTYHLGGASMGTTYEVLINEDDTTSVPVHIGPYIGLPGPNKDGLLLNVAYDGNGYSHPTSTHETENFKYVIGTDEKKPEEMSKVYKINKKTDEVTLVNEKYARWFKYYDGKLYFVSNDYKLYSISLNNDTTELESNGPIEMPGKGNYEILGKEIYYINKSDGKIYKEGLTTPMNSGEQGIEISSFVDYVVLKFDSTVPDSYGTIVYSKDGKELLKTPNSMAIISSDINKMAYYDENLNKIFLIELE